LIPGLSLALQPWAEISQRLRRFQTGLKLANASGVFQTGLKLANASGVFQTGLKLANAFGVFKLG